MNVIQPGRKRAVLVFLLAGFLLTAGCSYTVIPKSVPLAGGFEITRFTGISVAVQNAEKNDKEVRVRTETGGASAFKANERAWAQILAESLARELARRGADVRVSAPLTLSLTIDDIVFAETRETIEFRAKAEIVSSSGWTKEYKGSARMKTSEVFSVSREADRLAGEVVVEIVKAAISDTDFLDQLKLKQTT